MEIKKYVEYIKECRKRGFEDYTIKDSLLAKGWPENEIVKAFYSIDSNYSETSREEDSLTENKDFGSSVTIFLDGDLRVALEKRAKKNMLALPKQIEDILRRSTLNMKGKKSLPDEKLDDKLVGVFSRKNTGQKTKKKKAQARSKLTEEQRKKHAKEQRKYRKRVVKKARKEKRMEKRVERKAKKRK
jgi:hypothetical protein